MKLSIVIPNYNMGSKVSQCLETVLESTADKGQYEVIVCDSSTDGSMDELKKWCEKHDNLKVVHCSKRLSAGTARNIAHQQCSGEYVMCLDIDDKLCSKDILKKVVDGLDGKDIYACSYTSRKDKRDFILKPENIAQMAKMPVACWSKIVKRELWIELPPYMPEDVWTHFMLVDRCKTVGYFDFPVIDYDNTPENKDAMSRTFDWLMAHPSNLIGLNNSGELKKLGLKEEFITGVIHNLADMWGHKDLIKQPEVKMAYMQRFINEYRNFSTGIYVH